MKSIYTTTLTGTKMNKARVLAAGLKAGTRLSIFRRPDNGYDSEAMSVHTGPDITSPQVGWIPAKEFEDKIVKSVLFKLMSHGIGLHAVVTQYQEETLFVRADVCLDEPAEEVAA